MERKRVAIVTGGAQGIGEAIVRALAEEGALVIAADINEAKASALAERLGREGKEVRSAAVDMGDVEAIRMMVSEVEAAHGRLDILVNNAGLLHATPIEEIDEGEWDRILSVNLKGAFFAIQAALAPMRRAGYGRIVNISSLAGRMGGYANGVAYSASKAGLIGLTYAVARRTAANGITCNAVAPGTTESDIISGFSREQLAGLVEKIPAGRLGKTEDTAALVAFLASEKAGFINGAVVDVNGGMFTG